MVTQADPDVPLLGEPEIPGDEAEARGLVWAVEGEPEPEEEPPPSVPVEWVEDAVRGALALYQDEVVAAAMEELQRRLDEFNREFD